MACRMQTRTLSRLDGMNWFSSARIEMSSVTICVRKEMFFDWKKSK